MESCILPWRNPRNQPVFVLQRIHESRPGLSCDADASRAVCRVLGIDTGQQVGSYGFGGVGLANFSLLGYGLGQPVSFPVPPADIPPPSSMPTPRYGTVYGYPTHLQLPYTIQWNMALEQSLGKTQTLSITYVGSHAGRLLEQKF